MKKIAMLVLALAFIPVLTGCMLRTNPLTGETSRVLAPQVGANVQMLDLCGYRERSILYGTESQTVLGIEVLPNRAFWVDLPTSNGLTTNTIALTYVAMVGGEPAGSTSLNLYVDYNRGSKRYQWILTPDGRFGGQQGYNIFISRCP